MSSAAQPSGHGEWVTLIDGIQVPHRWLVEHTPRLYLAWRNADTEERRLQFAGRILQFAAYAESEPPEDDESSATRAWLEAVERVDPRLVRGPDWPSLAAALARADEAGYDVATNLPALAAAEPLPDRHPARELHWRLLDDCPAAAPMLPTRSETPLSATTGGPDDPPPPVDADSIPRGPTR